ncbi:MAG TPA: hypothetical protein VGG87_12495 [Solirubrobacteraceae bacterium]
MPLIRFSHQAAQAPSVNKAVDGVRPVRWWRGGPDGNEQLTAATGVVLLILLAALGVTIVFIGGLLSEHLFLGLLLLGPVALKMASTGYRFMRYYTHDREYVRRGPPELWLRVLGPFVVLSTVAVFATGVWLLIVGPEHRDPALLLHKVTFFVWLAATGLHVLGHLLQMPAALRATSLDGTGPGGHQAGAAGRILALTGAVVGGAVLAIALIPDFSIWTAHLSLLHHHHG